LQRRGFTSRVFLLLGYLPATANEHYQSGFKIFHLVWVELYFIWPLSANLSGMGNPTGDFISSQYCSTGHGGTQTFPPR